MHVSTDPNDDLYLVTEHSLPFELLNLCDIGTHCDALATRIETVRGEYSPVCEHCFKTALELEPDSDFKNGMRLIGDEAEEVDPETYQQKIDRKIDERRDRQI